MATMNELMSSFISYESLFSNGPTLDSSHHPNEHGNRTTAPRHRRKSACPDEVSMKAGGGIDEQETAPR